MIDRSSVNWSEMWSPLAITALWYYSWLNLCCYCWKFCRWVICQQRQTELARRQELISIFDLDKVGCHTFWIRHLNLFFFFFSINLVPDLEAAPAKVRIETSASSPYLLNNVWLQEYLVNLLWYPPLSTRPEYIYIETDFTVFYYGSTVEWPTGVSNSRHIWVHPMVKTTDWRWHCNFVNLTRNPEN